MLGCALLGSALLACVLLPPCTYTCAHNVYTIRAHNVYTTYEEEDTCTYTYEEEDTCAHNVYTIRAHNVYTIHACTHARMYLHMCTR